MKKFIILSLLLLLPVQCYAVCKIDSTEACTTISLREPLQKVYRSTSIINSPTAATLKPINKNTAEKELRKFGPQPSDYNYNTSCQFGICRDDLTNKLFSDRN